MHLGFFLFLREDFLKLVALEAGEKLPRGIPPQMWLNQRFIVARVRLTVSRRWRGY